MGPCGPPSAQRGLARRALALGWATGIGGAPPMCRQLGPGPVGAFYLESIFIDSNMYPLRIRPPDKPGLNLPDNQFGPGPWGPAGWGDPDAPRRRSFASDQAPASSNLNLTWPVP
jgi:hypothetical protein